MRIELVRTLNGRRYAWEAIERDGLARVVFCNRLHPTFLDWCGIVGAQANAMLWNCWLDSGTYAGAGWVSPMTGKSGMVHLAVMKSARCRWRDCVRAVLRRIFADGGFQSLCMMYPEPYRHITALTDWLPCSARIRLEGAAPMATEKEPDRVRAALICTMTAADFATFDKKEEA